MEMGSIGLSSSRALPANQEEQLGQAAGACEKHVAFDDLYQRYYPRVLAFLRFRTGLPDVAEDLASLVFERALLHLRELQAYEAAGAWLFRVARNCATDYFRRRQVEVSLDMLLDVDHPGVISPEEIALAHEERVCLLAHLKQLSEREREIIGLKFVAHLRNREIARVLHIPEGTVSSILFRALARLRGALQREIRE